MQTCALGMYFTLDLVTFVLDWRSYAEGSCLPPEQNRQQNWAGGCWLAGIVPHISACCILLTFFFYFKWNFPAFPNAITPFSTFIRLSFSWWSLELALHIPRKESSRL